jgi:hypothetical protein
MTIEAWCKTASGAEGYSRQVRNGSSFKLFILRVLAPDENTLPSAHEVIKPGPIIE